MLLYGHNFDKRLFLNHDEKRFKIGFLSLIVDDQFYRNLSYASRHLEIPPSYPN